jgi:hypothetical protein
MDVSVIVNFTLKQAVSGILIVSFPAGFTVTAPATSGGLTSSCLSGFGFNAQARTLTAEKLDCPAGVVIMAGAKVNNPPAAGLYTVSWVNDDPGSVIIPITDDDAVSVYGNIDPTLTFDLDVSTGDSESAAPYSVDLGGLTSAAPRGSGLLSIPSIWLDLETNATAGAIVTVRSANGSLKSTSSPSDAIASASELLAANDEGYGLCVASATGLLRTETPALTFTAASPYADSGNCTAGTFSVGLLQTTDQNLLAATGPIDNGRSQLRVGASVTNSTPAHPDYTDVLTFIATATY